MRRAVSVSVSVSVSVFAWGTAAWMTGCGTVASHRDGEVPPQAPPVQDHASQTSRESTRESTPRKAAACPMPALAETLAGQHLCTLAGEHAAGRVSQTQDAKWAAGYVAEQLAELSMVPLPGSSDLILVAPRHLEGPAREETYYNVAGVLPGSEGERVEGAIVISAHLDGVGQTMGGAFVAGANDDASGVAVMLELADRLRANPVDHPVWFLAFDGEELGLVGSALFAEQQAAHLARAKMGLNLEMLGRNDGDRGWWMTGLASSDAHLAFKTAQAPEPIGERKPDFLFRQSDNYSLFSRGCLPSFTLSAGDIGPSHHTADDNLEGIDPEVLGRSVDVAEYLVRAAARSDHTVTFNPALQRTLDGCRHNE